MGGELRDDNDDVDEGVGEEVGTLVAVTVEDARWQMENR